MKVFLIFARGLPVRCGHQNAPRGVLNSANAFITRILFVPSAVTRVVLVRPKLPSPSAHSVAELTAFDSATVLSRDGKRW